MPGDPPINANRELVAAGAANSAVRCSAMPAGGGTFKNGGGADEAGSHEGLDVVTAGAALATMLLLAPLLGLLPNATLAAVVIFYSVRLIQPAEVRRHPEGAHDGVPWALIACLGVLVFGTLKGIVVAIIVSVTGLASQPPPRVQVIGRKRGTDVLRVLSGEHDDETFEGLLLVSCGPRAGCSSSTRRTWPGNTRRYSASTGRACWCWT